MPNGMPWGDAFLISTPNIDRVGQQMIADQKMREQNYQRQNQQLDSEFAKNVAGIRDADVPDLTKKWGEYKQLKQRLYREGGKLKDVDRIALDMESQRKLGEAYAHIGSSKKEREAEETYAKDILKNPNNYEDNAHDFMLQRRSRPISQFVQEVIDPKTGKPTKIDYTDIDGNVRYKLGTTDFNPIINKAKGTVSLRGNPVEADTPDGLQKKITTYKAGNSPTEYINALQGGVVGSQKTKHLSLEFNYTDDEANKIILDYAQLKQTPEFKAAYPNEPDIPESLMRTPTGRTMAIMAMENALLHPPVSSVKTESNVGAIMDKKRSEGMADWLKKNKITFGQSMAKIAANKANGVTGEDGVRYLTDEYVSKDGEVKTLPYVGEVTFVPEDKVDAGDLAIINGSTPSTPGVKGITIGDKRYFKVLPNGDWEGEKGRVISRDAVVDRYLKGKPKLSLKVGSKADRNTKEEGRAKTMTTAEKMKAAQNKK